MPNVLHAECRSNDGTLRSSSLAMRLASAGMQVSGEQPPAMTIPMSEGLMPARSIAMSAARRPVSAFEYSAASGAGPHVLVLGRANVIERQNRAPGLDADPLDDPLVVGPDFERLEKGVVDLIFGVEMAEAVEVEHG